MSYTSALLTPSNRITTLENSSTKGIDYRTDFEKILEFHDELYLNDFNNRNLYYKALLESDEVLNEGVFTALSGIIAGIVLSVTAIFAFFFKGNSGGGGSSEGKVNSKLQNILDSIEKGGYTKVKADKFIKAFKENNLKETTHTIRKGNFGIFTNSDPDFNNIFDDNESQNIVNRMVECIRDFVSQFKQNLANGTGKFNDENYLNQSIDLLNDAKDRIKALNPNDWSQLKTHDEEINASELAQLVQHVDYYKKAIKTYNDTDYKQIKDLNSIIQDLNELDKIIKNASNSNDGNTEKSIEICNKFIPYAREAILIYSNKIGEFGFSYAVSLSIQQASINSAMDNMMGEKRNTPFSNALKDSDNYEYEFKDGKMEKVYKSELEQAQFEAAILDEQFSNSLAAIYKDLKWSYMDAYRQGYVNEAVILSENAIDKDKKLIELNEAIGTKVKSAFNNAVAKIRELFSKFMEKLRANFTSTKNYLDKYKKYILGTTITYNYKGKDILAGMYRVMNFTIPAFDYKSIENDLADPQLFFERQLVPIANKVNIGNITPRAINVNVENSNQTLSQIGEWFKQYFGCAGEDGEIIANQVQNSIKDIYDFMYDISKIEKSINDSIKNIEGLRDRALQQAGVERVDTESTMYLNHIPVLLEDWGAPQQQNTNNQTQTNNTTNNNGSGVASNMTNVASTGQNVNGQEQYGVGMTKKEDVDAKCNVYIQTVTKVLQAKLTAVEFLRNEFMALFRNLVQRNVEGNANPNGNTPTNTANMPGAQQQAPAQPAGQQTGKKKGLFGKKKK